MKTVDISSQIQIKNVLFATDFSPAADAAIPRAVELARRYGARLYALHVRQPVVNPMTPPAAWKNLERAAEIKEERQRRELLKAFQGIRPEILIKEGDLWSNLEDTIEECKIDLIVIGTRGRSGIRKFVLGSVAEEIFRQAACPVLTIGPHSTRDSKRSVEFARILLATDFGAESAAATGYAISLAQEYQAHLTLLHVIEEPKTGDLVRPFELVSSSTHLLRKLVPPEAENWCTPEFAVEQGGVAEKILEVARNSEVDLIVLGSRQPSGIPGAATHLPIGTVYKVVSQADCPVLTVRG
jgi:nucleotide-binding universal stress UspA family protein